MKLVDVYMFIKNNDVKISSPISQRKNPLVNRIRQSILLKQCDSKLPPLSADTVEFSPEVKLQKQARRIFSRSKKFSISDYNNLSKLEKAVLRQAVSMEAKQAAQDSLKVGLKVKEKLDKRYDKYVFCSVGTSPTGIARVLEFTGSEVKYLPISHLNWLDNVEAWKKYSDKFPNYQRFLEEQGLSKKSVEDSDKLYLFYDYVQQGMSIIVFEKMMKEYFGLDLPNVGFHNLNFLCYSSCAEKIDPPQYSLDYVEKYMCGCGIEDMGGVPHLDIAEIDKIDECKNYENINAKMFNFVLIDELSKKGLLKENSENKNSL